MRPSRQGWAEFRTVGGRRVLARKIPNGCHHRGSGRQSAYTDRVLKRLAWVLLVVGGGGVAFAALAGTAVARPVCVRWPASPVPPSGWLRHRT